MLLRIAVHEESAAAECFGLWDGVQAEDIGPVIFGVDWRAGDGPIALGDRAHIANVLETGIVLASSGAGVSGGDVGAILFEVAGFLGVGPGLALEVVCQSF